MFFLDTSPNLGKLYFLEDQNRFCGLPYLCKLLTETVSNWSSLLIFSSLAAHFQIAPEAAAIKALSSRSFRSLMIVTSGSKPPYLLISTRVSCFHLFYC